MPPQEEVVRTKIMFGSAGFLIGIILGSFVKAAADRSLKGKSLGGRSYCPKCQHMLAWYDLLPVLSYILLWGKCRYCTKKIPLSYFLTEISLGVIIAYFFSAAFRGFQFPLSLWDFQLAAFSFDLIFKTFFITILAILFLTDIKKMLIPDRIILPAIAIGAVSLFIFTIYRIGYLYYYLSQSPIGRRLLPPHSEYFQRHALSAAEPLFYGLVTGFLIGAFFYGLIVLTRGKGMGGGDVKLGAFIGLMLGFPNALIALMLSILSGGIFSLFLIISGRKHFGQVIPFGPFLVLGSLITLFWGSQILNWYLHLSV